MSKLLKKRLSKGSVPSKTDFNSKSNTIDKKLKNDTLKDSEMNVIVSKEISKSKEVV